MSKTITISDETYDIISEFCKAIATQDNRSTRIPYVYAIRDTKRIYGIDIDHTNDGYVWMDEHGVEMFDGDMAFMNHIIEEGFDEDIDLEVLDDDDTVYGFKKTYYVNINKVRNFFLTEKAALEHLESYNYQYDDPSIKVIHLSGNNEIMGLITTLNEIIH